MSSGVNIVDETSITIVVPHRHARRVANRVSFASAGNSPALAHSPADLRSASVTPSSTVLNSGIPGEGTTPSTTTDMKLRFKGVRQRSWGVWVSEVREPMTRKKVWLGTYPSAEEAIRAHDLALLMVRNVPDSRLNRPQSQQKPAIVQRSVATALLLAARAGHVARCQMEAEKSGRTGAPPDIPVASFTSEFVKLELIGSNVHLTDYYPSTHTHTEAHAQTVPMNGSGSEAGESGGRLGNSGHLDVEGGAFTAANATSPSGSQGATALMAVGRKRRKNGVLPGRATGREDDGGCSHASGDVSGDVSGGGDAGSNNKTAERLSSNVPATATAYANAANIAGGATAGCCNGSAEQPTVVRREGGESRWAGDACSVIGTRSPMQSHLAAVSASHYVMGCTMAGASRRNGSGFEAQVVSSDVRETGLGPSAAAAAPSPLLHLLAAVSESATCEPASPVDSTCNAERQHAAEGTSTPASKKARRGIMLFGMWQDAPSLDCESGSPMQSAC